MDTGPVIAQREVTVFPSDDENSLAEKVKLEEHILYPKVIDLLASGNVESP
jgi:phosphoribosylglycinamide formyltransferase-1